MISDMCNLLKAVLKHNHDYIILHIDTNNASWNTTNELLDKILALKSFVTNNNKNCKVIISTLTMHVDDQKCGSVVSEVNPFSAKSTKWSNKLKQFVGNLPKNSLSVFDHFAGLALKGLMNFTDAATGGVLQGKCSRNFTKFIGKHLCQSLFFNKAADTCVFLWISRNF